MPRVPTIAGPSIAEQPLTGGFDRSNPQPIQNNQLAEAGRAMFEIGTQIQEIEDADALLREETVTKGKWLEWAAEAKQRKGQQAWGVAKKAASWWTRGVGGRHQAEQLEAAAAVPSLRGGAQGPEHRRVRRLRGRRAPPVGG